MKKQELYVITEKQYSNTNWYIRIMNGLYQEAAKKSFKIVFCSDSDLQSFEPGTILILIGSSKPFMNKYIQLCTKFSLRPIITGSGFYQTNMPVSYITINRYSAMIDIVQALISIGAKSIALLGVNSSFQTDMQRYEGWMSAVRFHKAGNPDTDVYFSDNGLPDCMEAFWKNVHKYDAVACTNDWYASYVCSHAREYGISIPEDLMVTGFGNTLLGQYTNPPLTTVSLNLSSVGTQVLPLHRLLSQNPDLQACTETLKSDIIFRESTKKTASNTTLLDSPALFADDFFSDFIPADKQHLNQLYALENTIGKMDETDYKMIHGLLEGTSYHALAENLFLSDTAFKYRLQKLFSSTGCNNRAELVQLFHDYIPRF
ncbi:MAG: substrate-binding domain-containing protein [Tyzzerella sp.]|nr:substrate-binding domain-containing protein [Tyzzerella sp.]